MSQGVSVLEKSSEVELDYSALVYYHGTTNNNIP